MKKDGTLTFLFLGGAKRVAIGRRFVEAARRRGYGAGIIGYELDARCPLASIGRIVEGRKWSDPAVCEHLEEIVGRYGVDALIPFVDGAVGVAAEFASRRPEVFVPAGDREMEEAMFDKCASAELFASLGIPVPATYVPGAPCTRLIAKPRFGSASKGIVAIDDPRQLDRILACPGEYLVQERIDRREEITVDCYASVADGAIAAASPRIRLEVAGGEAVRTVTVDDGEAAALARRVIAGVGLRGAVTVQLIRDLDSGRLMVMEVNPRLGGGVVASVNAGADIPSMIVDEILSVKPTSQKAKAGVLTVRYLEDIAFFPDEK